MVGFYYKSSVGEKNHAITFKFSYYAPFKGSAKDALIKKKRNSTRL
jgi:hypothetical protein